MTFKGLEYLSAGTLSYKVILMLFAESLHFLSKECVPLEVDDEKKNREAVTVSSESLLTYRSLLA